MIDHLNVSDEFFHCQNQQAISWPNILCLKLILVVAQIRCLITLTKECSIICIDSNVTDNIIRKVINVWLKTFRAKNRALWNTSIRLILLQSLSIHCHQESLFTEERWNKAKYMTWNSITPVFVQRISTSNLVKCHSSSSPTPIKGPGNSTRYDCQKICSDRKDLKPN